MEKKLFVLILLLLDLNHISLQPDDLIDVSKENHIPSATEEEDLKCDTKSFTNINPCPLDFNEFMDDGLKIYCIKYLNNVSYPPPCPFTQEPLANFDVVERYIKINKLDITVWMPAKRTKNEESNFDLIYWTYPTTGLVLDVVTLNDSALDYYQYEGSLIGKDCLIYHARPPYDTPFEAVSCNDTHDAICMYESLSTRSRSLCTQHCGPHCRQATYDKPMNCFCKQNETNVLADFLEPYQNLLFLNQLNESDECYFGLIRESNKFTWITSGKPVEDLYFSTKVSCDRNNIFGAITSNGWILKSQQPHNSSCVIHQFTINDADIHQPPPNISLEFNGTNIIATVINPKVFHHFVTSNRIYDDTIHCFTDASDKYIVSRIPILQRNVEHKEEINLYVASLDTHRKGPGNYWCEGYLYPHLNRISSNKIFVRQKDKFPEDYVAKMSTIYINNMNPLTLLHINMIMMTLINNLSALNVTLRIFTLDYLDELNNNLTFTMHITSNNSQKDEYDNLMANLTHQHKYQLIQLASVDYCIGTSSRNLQWPNTQIGEIAERSVDGYCIDVYGHWASRACSGDFINGAQWQEVLYSNCTLFKGSKITDLLFKFIKSDKPSIEDFNNILYNFNDHLQYIDLYFLNLILKKLDLNMHFILNVMNFIIEEFPQGKDPLPSLTSMPNILDIYKEIVRKNLKKDFPTNNNLRWLKIVKSNEEANKTIYGVILQNNFEKYNLIMAEKPITVKYLESFGNVDSVLVFDDDLIKQLNARKTIFAVSVFLNNLQIGGLSLDSNTKIYSFILEEDSGIRSPFTIYLNISQYSNNQETKCAFWHPEGKWIISNPNVEVGNLCSNYMICTFPSISSYFTVTSTNETNITKELIYLKNSKDDIFNKLKLMFILITEVGNLNVFEVKIVTDILQTAAENISEKNICPIFQEVAVPIFSDIISNLMKIPKEIMMQAKAEANVPERLLKISQLISKQLKQSDNDNENFNVIVSDAKKSKPLGFMYQKDCRRNCGLKEITDMSNLQNVEAAIFFNDTLWNQNFILTVYSNDVLFTESYEKPRHVSKIFGLDVRDNDEKLHGNFSILYNVSVRNRRHELDNCVFWNSQAKKWVEEELENMNSENNLRQCVFNFQSYFTLLTDSGNNENITSDIEDILLSNCTPPEKIAKLVNVSQRHQDFAAVDIHLVCEIFQLSAKCSLAHNIYHLSKIVDNLMKISRETLFDAESTYEATNGILNCIDHIVSNKNTTEQHLMLQENVEEKKRFYGDNFDTIIIDLNNTDVVGLTISECSPKCHIDLFKNFKTIEDLEKINNFEAAVFLSPELLEQIKSAPIVSKLIVTTFLKDSLFNEHNSLTHHRNTSTIFGVLLPDFHEDFNGPIHIFYNKKGHIPKNCAFWDFSGEDPNWPGFWKNDGDILIDKSSKIAYCKFYHLTHFGLLLAGVDIEDKYHLLDIITLINCTLSLFGVMGILLTAILFEKWRRNTGNKILLNFSLALTIKIAMLYVSSAIFDPNNLNSFVCTVCGAILHYALLSEFCWMLVIAILQFKRFVEVLGGPPKYVLLKACICGWIFPLLPILILLILDPDNYTQGHTSLCYPTDLGLYLGVWLPIILIVGINFVIFLYIIINVFVSQSSKNKETMNSEMLFQWRLALLLFFMLGLTWSFGFLGLLQNMYVFLYLFCFTATLQGFIMFLFFILFNQSTRMLYWHSFKLWLYSKNLIKL